MPYVDINNVRNFFGKTIDCKRRRFRHDPLTFREIRGQIYTVDRNHVMVPFAEDERIDYDYIVEGANDNEH